MNSAPEVECTTGTVAVKRGMAQSLKGGVIMDVTSVEQAKLAERAGAVAVMALERIPADIRADGGVARMTDTAMILEIKKAVTIPVMAKARIGHFVEAQVRVRSSGGSVHGLKSKAEVSRTHCRVQRFVCYCLTDHASLVSGPGGDRDRLY